MTKRPRPGARRVPAGRRSRADARRRQRELELQAARRRRRRRLGIAAGLLAAVVLVLGLEILLHRPGAEERALLSAAPAAARTAGCTGARTIPPFPGGRDRTHVGGSEAPGLPPLSAYPSHPPVSGPHAPAPLPEGVYPDPPPIGQAIHSLEHAAVIVWYDPRVAGADELARLRRFFARGDERDHVIVAPYDYPRAGAAGRLSVGTGMALAAWHHLQTCAEPDLAVAYAFVSRYRFDAYRFWEYRGDAPERWFAPI